MDPRNFEKNKTIKVSKIEIAKNLYPSLCIFGNIVLNIINSLIIFFLICIKITVNQSIFYGKN